MTNLTQEQLAAPIANVVGQVMQGQGAAPKAASGKAPNDLASKDRGLIAGFKRKGIKEADIVLMDRADPSKPYNVRPFGNAEKKNGWIGRGRMVRRGERGVRGLFHISQTPQPALLERLALVRPQGLCRRTGGEENLLDRRQPGLPIRLIHQPNDAHDTACPGAVVRPTLRRTESTWRLRRAMSAFGGKADIDRS